MLLVMKGCPGLDGAIKLAKAHQKELAELYPQRFIAQLALLEQEDFGPLPQGAVSLSAGLFQALSQLGDEQRTGLKAELSALCPDQRVIELCEAFGGNPYLLPGRGYVLFRTDAPLPGERIVGFSAEGKAKTVESPAGIRYLTGANRGY